MPSSKFPPVSKHGSLEEVLPDVFFVTGSVTLKKPKMRFSRNMIVLRHGNELTIVNTVRLDDEGLAALDALGEVKHILRIAGFHGMDDPFYKDRYGVPVWALEGQVYTTGFDNAKAEPKVYFEADRTIGPDTELPIPDAKMVRIDGASPEGVLHLSRDGGILVSGDALQNWGRVDDYFSFSAGLMMRLMGFIKAHNVGPGWIKGAQPSAAQVAGLLDLDFDKVLPCHGAPVMSDAKAAYRPAIEKAVAKLS